MYSLSQTNKDMTEITSSSYLDREANQSFIALHQWTISQCETSTLTSQSSL